MEVISIDGIKYKKASLVAKQFKYTADYVGQLCRGKKIDAKLVGRTWYVNPLSLTEHKEHKNNKTSSDENLTNLGYESTVSRIDVHSVLRNRTARTVEDVEERSKSTNFSQRLDWQPVRYQEDDADLLPQFGHDHDRPSQSLVVEQAEATQLKVKGEHTTTKLHADELPEVFLKGKLKIKSIEDNYDISEENIAITGLSESKQWATSEAADKPLVASASVKEPAFTDTAVPKNRPLKAIKEKDATYDVEIKTKSLATANLSRAISFAPRAITSNQSRDSKRSRQSDEVDTDSVTVTASSGAVWPYLLLPVFILALAIVALLVEVSITTSDTGLRTTFSLSFLL